MERRNSVKRRIKCGDKLADNQEREDVDADAEDLSESSTAVLRLNVGNDAQIDFLNASLDPIKWCLEEDGRKREQYREKQAAKPDAWATDGLLN